MFGKLFANAGLSLDRLRALVEVGAAGSISKAADGDPIKQSQYSRQIKELEDFFQAKLVERHGKGIRLTAGGKELTRISRFFLLGLSNFQRGCFAEEQTFVIGAPATIIDRFLLPVVTNSAATRNGPRYTLEVADDTAIERRLHDLTLDFGVFSSPTISRPLQLKVVGRSRLRLWVPKALFSKPAEALQAFKDKRLPLVFPSREISLSAFSSLKDVEPRLMCNSFLEAKAAVERQTVAALLPDFLVPEQAKHAFLRVRIAEVEEVELCYRLAWNPRLLRLNSHASRWRDFLLDGLSRGMRERRHAQN